jgi:hypothetical protein
MAKKRIDLSGVKEFLFNHGEKVALGLCGLIAIVLGGWNLWGATSAGYSDNGKSWPEAFKDAQSGIVNKMNGVKAQAFDAKSIDPVNFVWDPIELKYVPVPYAQVREDGDFKRRNPAALTILDDPKSMRLDYIRSLVLVHDLNKSARTVKGVVPAGTSVPKDSLENRMKEGRAQTFVVVHAVFPMKEQVEEFRKALKYATQKELFDAPREEIPKILGINVLRYELTSIGGADVSKDPEVIVQYDPASKRLKLQPALEKLLREAMYDETSPPALEPYLYEGLAMPLPVLAYGRYPKFQFPGWQVAWGGDDEPEKKVVMDKPPPGKKDPDSIFVPGKGRKDKDKEKPNPNPQPGPVAPNSAVELDVTTIKDDKLREFDPVLSNRLFGDPDNADKKIEVDLNVFHVLGQLVPRAADNTKPGIKPGPGGGAKQDGSKYFAAWDTDPPKVKEAPPGPTTKKDPKDAPPPTVYPPWERDALVRFIDADVKPGKTYYYAVQVRIANPNHKKDDKVAAAFLAAMTELPLDKFSWVRTPSITIPQDSFLYAMDQHLLDEWANPANARKSDVKLPANATTFQVHQFVTERRDQEKPERDPYVIGDWVVIERQVVRKGERIGAKETVPFPAWRPLREAFMVPGTPGDPKKKIPATVGARIALKSEADAPVLIDFTGGKRFKPNTATPVVEEESAVEALILTFDADGKQRLRVQNSRDDAAAMQPRAQVGFGRSDDPPFQAISRQERWQATLRRIQDSLQAPAPPKK